MERYQIQIRKVQELLIKASKRATLPRKERLLFLGSKV